MIPIECTCPASVHCTKGGDAMIFRLFVVLPGILTQLQQVTSQLTTLQSGLQSAALRKSKSVPVICQSPVGQSPPPRSSPMSPSAQPTRNAAAASSATPRASTSTAEVNMSPEVADKFQVNYTTYFKKNCCVFGFDVLCVLCSTAAQHSVA